jgi:hypothetical protein
MENCTFCGSPGMLYDCGQPVCFKCSDAIDTSRERKPPVSVTRLEYLNLKTEPKPVYSHAG